MFHPDDQDGRLQCGFERPLFRSSAGASLATKHLTICGALLRADFDAFSSAKQWRFRDPADDPQHCVIEASTDLIAWTVLSNVQPSGRLTDSEAGMFKQRFYRVLRSGEMMAEGVELK